MRAILERFLMGLLLLVGERRPAQTCTNPQQTAPAAEPIQVPGGVETPVAVKPADWRLPTPAEIDRARGEASAHNLPRVRVCRGPGKGCGRNWQRQNECPDCYLIHWHDRRPSAEIVRSMERGDA